MILCLETATDVCSVGIVNENDPSIFTIRKAEGNHHSAEITLLIEACLSDMSLTINDLQAVAISNGPGSYTSLRVGVSTAKGICYALDIPLIAIDTLATLANACFKNTKTGDANILFCPMIDARRMEVYCQIFETENSNSVLKSLTDLEAKVIDNQSFSDYLEAGNKLIFSGNGAPKCQPIFENHPSVIFSNITTCSADFMFDLAIAAFHQKQFVDMAYHTPQYLKAPNITVSKKNVLG